MDNTELAETLSEKVIDIIQEALMPIDTILFHIQKSTNPETGVINLSMDELYAIAARLPTECAFLMAQANIRAAKQNLQDVITSGMITETITNFQEKKGDARERQKKAEVINQQKILADKAAWQIINAFKDAVERADKVYEGIKKIIDARAREGNFDRKPGYPVG